MPRKRQTYVSHLKPNVPVHPALSSPTLSTDAAGPSVRTVNKLLTDLRRSRGHNHPPPSGQSGAAHSPQSLGPLGLPSSSPSSRPFSSTYRSLSPRSKMAARRRARGPPGPPAPPSWSRVSTSSGIEASMHGPRRRRTRLSTTEAESGSLSGVVSGITPPLQGLRLPSHHSLQRIVLEHMADNWTWHVEQELYWVGYLPSAIREALLFVLADRGIALGREELHVLIAGSLDEDNEDQEQEREVVVVVEEEEEEEEEEEVDDWEAQVDNGPDSIRRLTIGPSMRSAKAYRWLGKVLAPKEASTLSTKLQDIQLSPHASLRTPQVSLTHLSLVGAPDPSWSRLLNLAPFLPQLTHLDLGEWPAPESLSGVTGFAATGRGSDAMIGHVALSALEQSALTLRRLGRGLSGLKYLGLDGCAGWMGVWTAGIPEVELDGQAEEVEASSTAPSRAARYGYLDFPSSFLRLTTLRLSPYLSPSLAHLFSSSSTFQEAVSLHTHDPLVPFPCPSPLDLLRVPEPSPGDKEYEGPRWVRLGTVQRSAPAIGTSSALDSMGIGRDDPLFDRDGRETAYTLQQAQRLPLWRGLSAYLDQLMDIRDLERALRKLRRAAKVSGGFAIVRGGVDDDGGEHHWKKEILERWERYEKQGRRRERLRGWGDGPAALIGIQAAGDGRERGRDAWEREFG